jgi:PAS domain S-box-containing protein
MFRHTPIGIFRVTPGGRILEANDAAASMLGYESPADLVARVPDSTALYVDPEDRQEWLERLRSDLTVTAFETRLRKADESWIWVELYAHATVDPSGNIVEISGLAVDVSSRKVAERGRRESEVLYRDLVERLPGAVYVAEFGAEGRWLFASPAIETLTGFAPEEWTANPGFWFERMHPEDREQVLMLEAHSRTTGERFVAEYRLVHQNGDTVWVRDDAAVVLSGGRPVLQGVMWDLTAQKRAEAEIRAALLVEKKASDRLRELAGLQNNFITSVSHELRTPVSVILGGAITLQRAFSDMSLEQQRKLVDSMADRANALNLVLADILDFERMMSGSVVISRERADVAVLVQEVVEGIAATSSDHPIEVDTEPAVADVNSLMVQRIVESLLRNALRHTPRGTPVWVHVEPQGNGAVVIVEDAGPGIPDDMKEVIFHPFRTGESASAHDPGVGIGLSLVAQMAGLHGGKAWVEDRPGGGASFRVFLPSH